MNRNLDPSISAGNRARRRGRGLIAAGAALALTGSGLVVYSHLTDQTDQGSFIYAPSPDDVNSPEANKMNLDARIQAQTGSLAEKAILLSGTEDPRIVAVSTVDTIVPGSENTASTASLSVSVKVDDATGQPGYYQILVHGHVSKETGVIIPGSVDHLTIQTSRFNSDGAQEHAYTYFASKQPEGWMIVLAEGPQLTDIPKLDSYVTWPNPTGNELQSTLSASQFELFAQQAEQTMTSAQHFLPVE